MFRRSRAVRVILLKNQAVLADPCIVVESFVARMRGMIGRRSLAPREGMWFPRCSSVHMWFMSIPLDLVFLKKERDAKGTNTFRILAIREGALPWSVLPFGNSQASDTLEIASGACAEADAREGDLVCLS